jgi:hypothetical protein
MRRSRDQWSEVVGEFERSGPSHDAFCAEQRLNVGSFRGWLYRLRNDSERGRVASSATRLLPVRVGPPGTTGDDDFIEVAVGGIVGRVRRGVGPAYVAELVARLRDRC